MDELKTIAYRTLLLGLGLAALIGVRLENLLAKAQPLLDELIARGLLSAEEARKFIEALMERARVKGHVEVEDIVAILPARLANPENPDLKLLTEATDEFDEELERLKKDRA
jgi:polyhydroxyalkanoate synthesis regulator phasin